MKAQLYTAVMYEGVWCAGKFVKELNVDMTVPPRAIMWGERLFLLERLPTEPWYYVESPCYIIGNPNDDPGEA
jgi:hypothetical protein